MRWNQIVMTILLIAGCASTAAAQSGWGLWIYTESYGVGESPFVFDPAPWEARQAFDSLQGCEEKKEKIWKVRQNQYKVKRGTLTLTTELKELLEDPFNSFVIVHAARGDEKNLWTTYVRLYCLPDTIDPREEKK